MTTPAEVEHRLAQLTQELAALRLRLDAQQRDQQQMQLAILRMAMRAASRE